MKPVIIGTIGGRTPAGHPVEFNITDSFLHDILVTAYDPGYGGSLYWGYIKREPKGVTRPRRPISIDKMWKLAYEGEPLEIVVAWDSVFPEEPRETIELTRQKLMEGVRKWIEFMVSRGRTQFMMRSLDPEDWDLDSEYADMIVQFALLGELTFG